MDHGKNHGELLNNQMVYQNDYVMMIFTVIWCGHQKHGHQFFMVINPTVNPTGNLMTMFFSISIKDGLFWWYFVQLCGAPMYWKES